MTRVSTVVVNSLHSDLKGFNSSVCELLMITPPHTHLKLLEKGLLQ